ncbi:MAG: hypothetical protein AB1453_10820 [Chloroflexota bacterium]|jgi:hypothetical protein
MARFHPLNPHPEAVPPEQVRFLDLKIEPWDNRQRVRLHARLTPFTKPPDIEVEVLNPSGTEIASTYIVENIDYDFVITLHLRNYIAQADTRLTLNARIRYPDAGLVFEQAIQFTI